MSPNNKNIEKLFSSSFEDYRHDLDLDGAWEMVESNLEKKKKRRFFWWIWPIGAIAFAVIAFFLFNQTVDVNEAEVATQFTQEQPNTTRLSDDQSRSMTTSDRDVVRPKAENTLNSSASNADRLQVNEDETSKQADDAITTNDVSSGRQKEVERNSQIPRATLLSSTTDGANVNQTTAEILNNPVISSRQRTARHEEDNAAEAGVLHTDAKNYNSATVQLSESLLVDEEVFDNLSNDENLVNIFNGINNLALLPISLFPISTHLVTPTKVTENKIILKEKIEKNKLFIEVYGGGIKNYVNTNLNHSFDSFDAPNQTFLDRWNQTQTTLGGYQMGIKVGKTLWKRMELSAGINYQKIINKIEWRENISAVHRVVWDDDAFFAVDDQGVRTTSGGHVIETEVRYRFVKAKQIHNYINIPIQLGYSKLLNQYSIGLHVGPVINLSHTFQGRILEDPSDIRSLTTDNYEDVYRTSVGLSALADLRLARRIGKSSDVFTSMSFQYNGSNVFQKDFDIKMTNHNLSIIVGFRQHLN